VPNGDDDMAMSAPAGTEEGGGGMEESQPMEFEPTENELLFRRMQRKGKRRHPRPHFREERKARRQPR